MTFARGSANVGPLLDLPNLAVWTFEMMQFFLLEVSSASDWILRFWKRHEEVLPFNENHTRDLRVTNVRAIAFLVLNFVYLSCLGKDYFDHLKILPWQFLSFCKLMKVQLQAYEMLTVYRLKCVVTKSSHQKAGAQKRLLQCRIEMLVSQCHVAWSKFVLCHQNYACVIWSIEIWIDHSSVYLPFVVPSSFRIVK